LIIDGEEIHHQDTKGTKRDTKEEGGVFSADVADDEK
jgi:hypothetical protein